MTVKRVPAGDLGTVVVGFTAASAHAVLPRLLERARDEAARRETRPARDGDGRADRGADDRRDRPRDGAAAAEAARASCPGRCCTSSWSRRCPSDHPLADAGPAADAQRPRRPGRHHVLAGAGAVLQRPADQHVHHRRRHAALRPVRHAGAHDAGAGALRASASRWCPRRRRRCIPRAWCSGRSARSASGRSSSTRRGAATAPTPRCCACCATCCRSGSGPPTIWWTSSSATRPYRSPNWRVTSCQRPDSRRDSPVRCRAAGLDADGGLAATGRDQPAGGAGTRRGCAA